MKTKGLLTTKPCKRHKEYRHLLIDVIEQFLLLHSLLLTKKAISLYFAASFAIIRALLAHS
jgi:hypothetical protein